MKAGIIQSNYLPWKGYFDIINDVDVFLFYDEVKYTKNDWRNRNLIHSKNALQWLTVPISSDAVHLKISEVEIKDKQWQEKHYRSLYYAYKSAPFFLQLEPFLNKFYLDNKWNNLSVLNQFCIKEIARFLGIKTKIENSKEYKLEGDRVSKIINLLKQVKADEYISGPGGKQYLNSFRKNFEKNNIRLTYKNYDGYPEYKQLHNPFTHTVSIIDMIANVKREEIPQLIWGWRKS